jgi:hypothetical protein
MKLSYNAAIFKIIAVKEYRVVPISVYSDQYRLMHPYNATERNEYPYNETKRNEYVNLSNSQWRLDYESRYVSQYGNLYLAIDLVAWNISQDVASFSLASSLPGDLLANVTARQLVTDSQDWVLHSPFVSHATNTTVTNLSTPFSLRVVHGFTTMTGMPSRIQISLHFMVVVIAMNIFKLCIMLYVVLSDRSEYIVTLGDATASFLRRPDMTTKRDCLLRNDTSHFVPRYPPTFDVLDDKDGDEMSHFPTNAWLPRPRRYNSVVRTDKGIPTVTV